MELFLTALGLALILESLGPLLMPQAWRSAMERALKLGDGQLKFVALIATLVGLSLISVFGL